MNTRVVYPILSENCRHLWWSWRCSILVAKENIYFCLLPWVMILRPRFYYIKL